MRKGTAQVLLLPEAQGGPENVGRSIGCGKADEVRAACSIGPGEDRIGRAEIKADCI
jgi:hypothetical protein